MTKSIIVKSQVKELAKLDSKPLSVSEEFYKALEEKVKKLIEDSCKRAKLNSRNTIMARDL
jgi:histone H3/H4